MKRIVQILFAFAVTVTACAQNAPMITRVVINGDLILTWRVQTVPTETITLKASYQPEISDDLVTWAPFGAFLSNETLTNATVSVRIPGIASLPTSFFRVHAMFDFAGENFIKKSMRNADLSEMTFTGADFFLGRLDGASFDNADLRAADFRSSSMQQISATNADFTLARLDDVNLNSANLTFAHLNLADLSASDLTFADLSGSDLRGANLQGATTTYTRLHNTRTDSLTSFDKRGLAIWLIVNNQGAARAYTNTDLTFADLSSGNLTNATMNGLDLTGVDFSNANLSGANLTNANMRQVDFRGMTIDDRTILPAKWRVVWDIINNPQTGRSLAGANLSDGFYIEVTLEGADIQGANFSSAVMDTPNFKNANAVGANFGSVNFLGGNFQGADLRNASFNAAVLQDVNFLGANLTGAAFFNGTRFSNTTMPDGTIRNF